MVGFAREPEIVKGITVRYTTRIIVPPKIRRSGLPGGRDAKHASQVIGIKKSFGFGDGLGLASPGHLRAVALYRDWAPFLAQQSVEEMTCTARSPQDVMDAVRKAVDEAGFRQPWGADADRLKTPFDVEAAAAAGFPCFTIDLTGYVDGAADRLSGSELSRRIEAMILGGDLPENWSEPYLDRSIDLPGDWQLKLTLEPLQRAAVKFGHAVQHGARMYEAIARASHGRPFEIGVCLDKSDDAATPLEHLFLGLELEARGVRITGLGLRFAGGDEEEFDERGNNLEEFEVRLREHVAIAQFCGPYKLIMHGGSDKFGIYPSIGRLCGEQLHVKTSGTSYLEGLRALLRADLPLFWEIAQYCQLHVAESAALGQHSVTLPEARSLADSTSEDAESVFLDERLGRRVLLAAYGSVFTKGRTSEGRSFKEAILETLSLHADLHHEIVAAHFEKHLRMLSMG